MDKTNGKPLGKLFLLGILSVALFSFSPVCAYADTLDSLRAGASKQLVGSDATLLDDANHEASEMDGLDLTAGAGTTIAEAGANADQIVLEPVVEYIMANVNDAVNVRQEPNEESETVGKLFKNCGGELLASENGWSRIKSGNVEGWVKDEYLLFGEQAQALREEVGSLKATIQTDALRVRKDATEDSGVYKLVKNGDKMTVVDQTEDGWVAVQVDEDTVGYVSAEYVDVEFKVDTGKTKQEIADEERAKELKKLSKNRGAVPTSVSDVQLLAALVQCEAGSQPYEGKLAVAAVVMNRVRSGAYPNSIVGVITQPGQFPPATNGSVASVAARGASSSCMQAAQAAVNGATNVGGACHFGRVGKAPGIVIGAHVFY